MSPTAPPPASDPSANTSTPLTVKPSSPPPVPQPTPQQAKKIANLNTRIAHLEAQLAATETKQQEVTSQLKTQDPQGVVKAHIKLLHDYNEIRDVGQGLMGMIADRRGVRVVDVQREFDVAEGD